MASARFSFVPISILALAGVPNKLQGLASGLMNTTQQVGGAVGVAAASSIFATRLTNEIPKLIAQGVPPPLAQAQAMVSGFSLAYWVLAVIAFVGTVLAIVLLRRRARRGRASDGAHRDARRLAVLHQPGSHERDLDGRPR